MGGEGPPRSKIRKINGLGFLNFWFERPLLTRDWKSERMTDLRTYLQTGVGSRDTCMSKNVNILGLHCLFNIILGDIAPPVDIKETQTNYWSSIHRVALLPGAPILVGFLRIFFLAIVKSTYSHYDTWGGNIELNFTSLTSEPHYGITMVLCSYCTAVFCCWKTADWKHQHI